MRQSFTKLNYLLLKVASICITINGLRSINRQRKIQLKMLVTTDIAMQTNALKDDGKNDTNDVFQTADECG
jgi:hypothetical protein